jgi:hypothetical protein
MAMKVRRIVTGHNASGRAIVKTDEQVTAVPRVDAGISGCEIWSTDQMPIDNSSAADAAQRAGFVKHNNYVGNGPSRGAPQLEGRPAAARGPVLQSPTAHAGAGTSARRMCLEMASAQSASSKASRPASRGPSGCRPALPRIARDWQNPVSRQSPQALKWRFKNPVH